MKWSENLAFIEWQVARLAAGCDAAATMAKTPQDRREAARLNASFAVSSYALMTSRSPFVQVLSLAAMAELSYLVWVEEGHAAAVFGEQAEPVEAAIRDIREHTRAHAAKHLSADELSGVEQVVRTWRNAHPEMAAVEFIRFDAFADEFAREAGKTADVGGMFGRITGEARNLEFLGERLLLLMNRMPRLAQWHAEAAAANMLDQPEIIEAFTALKQLGQLQQALPEHLKILETLDLRLTSLPAELAAAVTRQPEFKDALAQLKETGQQVQALERSVGALEKAVASLDTQLTELATAARPETLRQLADHAGGVASARARFILLLATGCGAALLILHALLRRWSNPHRTA